MVKLSDDLLHLVPFEDGSLCKEVTPDNYVEGPFYVKASRGSIILCGQKVIGLVLTIV